MRKPARSHAAPLLCLLLAALLPLLPGCKDSGGKAGAPSPGRSPAAFEVVVDSLDDGPPADDGRTTLREALESVDPGGTITFAPALSGGTIALSAIATDNTRLPGEVFEMVPGVGWNYLGFQDRNYGASALLVEKDVTIDASSLPGGITLRWAGGAGSPARVLAASGTLSLSNVTILDGFSRAVQVDEPGQKYTLARGGALAVWGTLRLSGCTLAGNRVLGDGEASRDRGAFGGAVYVDLLDADNCVVAGNRAEGYGAAGGGIYSLSGYGNWGLESSIRNSSVTGNRVTAQHAYGGGIYTDGGTRGYLNTLAAVNCTVARNVVEDNPAIAESRMAQFYYRGGGVYMSNGYLRLSGCTVAENRVAGVDCTFNGKPNMAGGGVAATVGDAHEVEDMTFAHSVFAGNTVQGAPSDIFTGSLLHFYSHGFNRIGTIDFSQILVPIPDWQCLSRKHYPKVGDEDGVALSDALVVAAARLHPSVVSAGTDNGSKALLWYPPGAASRDRIPANEYNVPYVYAGYDTWWSGDCSYLFSAVLTELSANYRSALGNDFAPPLGDLSTLTFYATPSTWPSDPENAPWIAAWRGLDNAIAGRLGQGGLGDEFWYSLGSHDLNGSMYLDLYLSAPVQLADRDQRGVSRPGGASGDVGAVELAAGEAVPADPPASGGGGGGCAVSPGSRDGAGPGAGDLLPLLAAAALLGKALRRRTPRSRR
jgi:hypothetical protein